MRRGDEIKALTRGSYIEGGKGTLVFSHQGGGVLVGDGDWRTCGECDVAKPPNAISRGVPRFPNVRTRVCLCVRVRFRIGGRKTLFTYLIYCILNSWK